MTRANRKRKLRGDYLVYEGLQHNNIAIPRYYKVKNQFYRGLTKVKQDEIINFRKEFQNRKKQIFSKGVPNEYFYRLEGLDCLIL